jgi:hypothetical protein
MTTSDSKLSYPYKLAFKDSNGIIKGYSLSDPRGPDETKSSITGTINTNRKEISFKENNIIETRSDADKNSFCFVKAHLKLKETKGLQTLKGSFTGYMADGNTECAKGEIVLFSKENVLSKLMKLNPKIDTAALAKQIKEAANNKTSTIELLPGKTVDLTSQSSTAAIEIWDDEKIDGDIVSVLHNSKTILDHYAPGTDKKQLVIILRGDMDTITLKAISEGALPPNTTKLKLIQDNQTWLLNASTTIGQPSYIILKGKHSK